MSDNALLYVPAEPNWQPTQDAATRAVALFWTIAAGADKIEANFTNAVEFYHPYGNWEGVRCQRCSVDLED